MRRPAISFMVGFAAISVWSMALLAAPPAPGLGKDILGNGLDELEKTVDALPKPHAKPPATTRAAKPPIKSGDGDGILGNDLAELEKTVGALPGKGGGAATRPGGDGGATAVRGKVVAADWDTRSGRSGTAGGIKGGQLTLSVTAPSGGTSAEFKRPLKGDFDVQVEYDMTGWDPRKSLMSGFGIRIESAAGWTGDKMLSLNRMADLHSDSIRATVGEGDDPIDMAAENPKGQKGALRVQRVGERLHFFYRDEGASDWVEMGAPKARLSPEVRLSLSAFKAGEDKGAELRVTVESVEVRPAR